MWKNFEWLKTPAVVLAILSGIFWLGTLSSRVVALEENKAVFYDMLQDTNNKVSKLYDWIIEGK